jgi:hypothetical protein
MNELALKKTLEKLDINFDRFMQVYNSFNYAPFSAEEFIFTDKNFISNAMPEKLLSYIKECGLSIDTTHLEKCIEDQKKYSRIEDTLTDLHISASYSTDDDFTRSVEDEIVTLLVEQDNLISQDELHKECLRLKQIICEQS